MHLVGSRGLQLRSIGWTSVRVRVCVWVWVRVCCAGGRGSERETAGRGRASSRRASQPVSSPSFERIPLHWVFHLTILLLQTQLFFFFFNLYAHLNLFCIRFLLLLYYCFWVFSLWLQDCLLVYLVPFVITLLWK